jgi:hypothetical protein
MLSQMFVFRKSKNFTSDNGIRMPPTTPLNHYSGPTDQQIGQSPIVLFHANVFRADACFEHSNLLKVTSPTPSARQLSPAARPRQEGKAEQCTPEADRTTLPEIQLRAF